MQPLQSAPAEIANVVEPNDKSAEENFTETPQTYKDFDFTKNNTNVVGDVQAKQSFEYKTNSFFQSHVSAGASVPESDLAVQAETESQGQPIPLSNELSDAREPISDAQQQILANVISQSINHEAEHPQTVESVMQQEQLLAPDEAQVPVSLSQSDLAALSLEIPKATSMSAPFMSQLAATDSPIVEPKVQSSQGYSYTAPY